MPSCHAAWCTQVVATDQLDKGLLCSSSVTWLGVSLTFCWAHKNARSACSSDQGRGTFLTCWSSRREPSWRRDSGKVRPTLSQPSLCLGGGDSSQEETQAPHPPQESPRSTSILDRILKRRLSWLCPTYDEPVQHRTMKILLRALSPLCHVHRHYWL